MREGRAADQCLEMPHTKADNSGTFVSFTCKRSLALFDFKMIPTKSDL